MSDAAGGFSPLPFCSRCGGYHASTTGGCPWPAEMAETCRTVDADEMVKLQEVTIAALRADLQRARDEAVEHDQLIALQHRRTVEADKRWRAAHPERGDVMPDLGELVEWLMLRADLGEVAGEERDQQRERADFLEARVAGLGDEIRQRIAHADQLRVALGVERK